LIAEGFAQKHQQSGFQKYPDDAMGECSETVVSLEQMKEIYGVETAICTELVGLYDKSARQLFKLAGAWDSFKSHRQRTRNNTGRNNI